VNKDYNLLLVCRGIGIYQLDGTVPSRAGKPLVRINHRHFRDVPFSSVQQAFDVINAYKGDFKYKRRNRAKRRIRVKVAE